MSTTRTTAVILVELALDDCAAGDPQTEAVRDVVLSIAHAARHRLAGAGVKVGDIRSALVHQPAATPSDP